RIIDFGDYQDAMLEGQAWIYHSHISMYINSGLLLPMECIKAALKAYYNGNAPLNAVVGFIRQILVCRELVIGNYWLKM
ncbi:cryptochrome/photolyase family protein, partial [Francisella tularensis subsp. holarctica]|nr:cryptochrome/photolyase family protein [Francisella tularensis subsp. holarctica]